MNWHLCWAPKRNLSHGLDIIFLKSLKTKTLYVLSEQETQQ